MTNLVEYASFKEEWQLGSLYADSSKALMALQLFLKYISVGVEPARCLLLQSFWFFLIFDLRIQIFALNLFENFIFIMMIFHIWLNQTWKFPDIYYFTDLRQTKSAKKILQTTMDRKRPKQNNWF
jgi:hypothetical protein